MSAVALEERIMNEFFEDVDQMISTLQRLKDAGNALLGDMKENLGLKHLGERVADINRDLDNVREKVETLDHEILKGVVERNPDEEQRLREYEEQKVLFDTFAPAMLAYSSLKN